MTRLSIGGKSRKRGEPFPGPLPGRHRLGVLDPSCRTRRSRSEPARRPPGSGRCRSALRAAATFRLSPIGDEPHRGARNRVDHTGGGRGLGPGLPAFALGRPVSPSHSPARFALKWEVPPSTISTSLTLRLCQHGRTRAALQGGSLLGPGAQILKPRA